MRQNDPHPVIIISTITFEDLTRAVRYMYTGEVEIADDDLDSFMSTAAALGIKCTADAGTPITTHTKLQSRDKLSSALSTDSADSSPSMESCSVPKRRRMNPKVDVKTSKVELKVDIKTSQKVEPVFNDRSKNAINKKSVSCQFCSKLYQAKKSMKFHEGECQQNPNRKCFKCHLCERTFTRNYCLSAHEKTHEMVDSKYYKNVSVKKELNSEI